MKRTLSILSLLCPLGLSMMIISQSKPILGISYILIFIGSVCFGTSIKMKY